MQKEISEWNTSDLCNWLLANKFRGISELFQKYSISGYDLFFIDDDILKNELGLSSFHERKVALKLITKLTYEHLKLNVINANGDNVILTLDNNPETSLGEISEYIGNMFNIDPKNILYKDNTKQEVLSPTVKIIKLLILYPKIYKTLNISNIKDYHQIDEELAASNTNYMSKADNNNNTNNNNNMRLNSVASMGASQSLEDPDLMNQKYMPSGNINNNYQNNYGKNYKNNQDNYLINSGMGGTQDENPNMEDGLSNININNMKYDNNMMRNNNVSETPLNDRDDRKYKSEQRVYRSKNDQMMNMNNNYMEGYGQNELSLSSGNEEELKFKPSYQIKKPNNNKNDYYSYQNNFEIENPERRENNKTGNKSFYKNKVFNEDFVDDKNNYKNNIS